LYFCFRPRYYRLKKRGPLIVLVNHATEFDILLTDTLFNFPLYFVASEQLLNKGFPSWLLNYVFAPIPKSKSMSDIAVVPRIKRVLDEGGNVCIFPEGNMTMTGNVSSMPSAIGKLIKLMKVPIVIMESYGLYFSSPRWSVRRKFGPTGIKLKRIIEVAEFDSLSGDSITDLIKNELSINAFEQRPIRKYRGFNKAAGLHRLVFTCPSCHQPFTMKSGGSKLWCSACGYVGHYDVHGYVNGPTGRFDTVALDHMVKKDYVKYVGQHIDDLELSAQCDVRYFVSGAKRRSKKYKQMLKLSHDGLSLISKKDTRHYSFENIYSYTMQTRRKFIIYVRGNLSIVAKLPVKDSTYQYLITMQLLHNHDDYLKGTIDYDLINNPDDTSTLGL